MREDDVYKEIKKAFNSKVCKKYFDKDILIKMLMNIKKVRKIIIVKFGMFIALLNGTMSFLHRKSRKSFDFFLCSFF